MAIELASACQGCPGFQFPVDSVESKIQYTVSVSDAGFLSTPNEFFSHLVFSSS